MFSPGNELWTFWYVLDCCGGVPRIQFVVFVVGSLSCSTFILAVPNGVVQTRFSGIVAQDLDPSKTTHNLISTRSAYLKLRYLMERGCIFVGHGLRQDFATVNLAVPPHQILDTVEIFHHPGRRYLIVRSQHRKTLAGIRLTNFASQPLSN